MSFKEAMTLICTVLVIFLVKLPKPFFMDLLIAIICVPVLLFETYKGLASYLKEKNKSSLMRLLFYVCVCMLLFYTIVLMVQKYA